MTLIRPPYFLSNRDWYTTPEDEGIDDFFFDDDRGYHIKDDAPEEAKKSYEDSMVDMIWIIQEYSLIRVLRRIHVKQLHCGGYRQSSSKY